MKRILTILAATLLLTAAMAGTASASSYDSVAEELSAIGVFRGTAGGFELDRAPTRSEAAIMLVRLYGAEDEAKAAYEAAEARYRALVAQKEAARSQYAEASRRTVGAEANILRREADLDMARLNLSYTVLTAPYDGYIGRRTLEPGQFVQAGQTVSYLVRNRDKYITANYKETQIAHIHIGQEVVVKVDAFPGRRFRGRVTAISEATGSKYALVPTDNSAGNFVKVQQRIPVRIDLEGISDEEMDLLRAGMMVETEARRR